MHLISKFKFVICQMKKTICKILRTNKNNNFKFTIKFLMTLDRSYIGYLGFLGIHLLKNVLILKVLFASADYFLKWVFLQCRGERDCIGEGDMLCTIGLATFRYMVNTQKKCISFICYSALK